MKPFTFGQTMSKEKVEQKVTNYLTLWDAYKKLNNRNIMAILEHPATHNEEKALATSSLFFNIKNSEVFKNSIPLSLYFSVAEKSFFEKNSNYILSCVEDLTNFMKLFIDLIENDELQEIYQSLQEVLDKQFEFLNDDE